VSRANVWIGRVFTAGGSGGNHTAIVTGTSGGAAPDRAAVARRLGFPDCGFVVADDGSALALRTYSPYEELGTCLQTSLGAVVATKRRVGDVTRVCHSGAEPLLVTREIGGPDDEVWARSASGHALPSTSTVTLGPPVSGPATRLGGARPRLYMELGTAADVEHLDLDRVTALDLLRAHDVRGLVVFAVDRPAGVVRLRVFTTSLDGGEDAGTGGAVLDLGGLLAASGLSGALVVTQGGTDPGARGELLLRVGADGVAVGAEVHSLAEGTLA
jgi:predicted PhzF superfamily epimerase YddE/YHI9